MYEGVSLLVEGSLGHNGGRSREKTIFQKCNLFGAAHGAHCLLANTSAVDTIHCLSLSPHAASPTRRVAAG